MALGGFGLEDEFGPDEKSDEVKEKKTEKIDIDLEKIMDMWEIQGQKLTKDEKKAVRRIFSALGYDKGGEFFLKRMELYRRTKNNYELIDFLIREKILIPEKALEDLGIDGVVSNDDLLYQLNMEVLYNL
ncbi:hypothetical protein HYX16_04715 [Candidatus Woesearchaeota archaeon]|nr:hypothetical protein [Candidatus Woesearchaeota archaeon]